MGQEIRGQREKHWVRAPDATLWLRKRHRASRPYEPAIEVFALDLARACYIESAQAMLASWRDDTGALARGVCVLSFLMPQDELVAGYEVLCAVDRSYDPENRMAHTLDRVARALRDHEQHTDQPLLEPFCRMLLFDAWIGNTDRHPGNWSLVRRQGSLRFSPMYDPAGSLGAELQPGARQLRRPDGAADAAKLDGELQRYISLCPSGFGDGRDRVNLDEVTRAAAGAGILPRAWLPYFEVCLRDQVPGMLAGFTEEALPQVRKDFIVGILGRRLAWLKGLS